MRLYRQGSPVEEVHKLIAANVRVPHMTLGDIGAQVAACSVGERALQDLARRYGRPRLTGLMTELIDYTETLGPKGDRVLAGRLCAFCRLPRL